MNPPERNRSPLEGQVDLTELLLVVLKRKGIILLVTLAVLAGAVVYSLRLEDRYQATARVLPSPQETEVVPGSSPLEGQRLITRLFTGQPISDLFVGILESRSLKDRIIDRFDLKDVYGVTTMDGARAALSRHMKIEFVPDTRLISITAEDEDPGRAAELSNAHVDELDQFNRSLQRAAERIKRRFLETRLVEVKKDLLEVESRVKQFRQESGLVDLDIQTRSAIETAAKIRVDMILAQTDLAVFQEFGTGRRNRAIELKTRIRELERHLAQLEDGMPRSTDSEAGKNRTDPVQYTIPFAKLPFLGMTLSSLQREAALQEEIYRLITTQYELTKIEEAKDMRTVQVLDRAVSPDRPSGPDRKLILAASGGIGFLVAVFLAFFLEFLERLRMEHPEQYRLLRQRIRPFERTGGTVAGRVAHTREEGRAA